MCMLIVFSSLNKNKNNKKKKKLKFKQELIFEHQTTPTKHFKLNFLLPLLLLLFFLLLLTAICGNLKKYEKKAYIYIQMQT